MGVSFEDLIAAAFLKGQIDGDQMFLAAYWAEINPQKGN